MSTATVESCRKGTRMSLYYNTGTLAAPVWVQHVGVIEDLDMNEDEELNELSGRRSSRQVKEYDEGEVELSITGTQLTDPEYEGWQFLNSMRTGGISREVLCLTGDIGVAGSYGWRGDFRNAVRTTRGPATGSMVNPFDLKPASKCHADWSEPRVVKIVFDDPDFNVDDFDPTTYEASA